MAAEALASRPWKKAVDGFSADSLCQRQLVAPLARDEIGATAGGLFIVAVAAPDILGEADLVEVLVGELVIHAHVRPFAGNVEPGDHPPHRHAGEWVFFQWISTHWLDHFKPLTTGSIRLDNFVDVGRHGRLEDGMWYCLLNEMVSAVLPTEFPFTSF